MASTKDRIRVICNAGHESTPLASETELILGAYTDFFSWFCEACGDNDYKIIKTSAAFFELKRVSVPQVRMADVIEEEFFV